MLFKSLKSPCSTAKGIFKMWVGLFQSSLAPRTTTITSRLMAPKATRAKKLSFHGQWWRLSWYSCRFLHQRSAVQILSATSMTNLNLEKTKNRNKWPGKVAFSFSSKILFLISVLSSKRSFWRQSLSLILFDAVELMRGFSWFEWPRLILRKMDHTNGRHENVRRNNFYS